MDICSRFGKGLLAAAVVVSLQAGAVFAQEGYVDVRVNTDDNACGTVVLKWPLDDGRAEAQTVAAPAPQGRALEPVSGGMAEVTPIPVIHAHPALNLGSYFFPPVDGYYRHFSPETEVPPPAWNETRAHYENELRRLYGPALGQFTAESGRPMTDMSGRVAPAPGTVLPVYQAPANAYVMGPEIVTGALSPEINPSQLATVRTFTTDGGAAVPVQTIMNPGVMPAPGPEPAPQTLEGTATWVNSGMLPAIQGGDCCP